MGRGPAVSLVRAGHAEVDELHHLLAPDEGEEDVPRLQISMDDARGVDDVEPLGDLVEHLCHGDRREAPLAREADAQILPSNSSITM